MILEETDSNNIIYIIVSITVFFFIFVIIGIIAYFIISEKSNDNNNNNNDFNISDEDINRAIDGSEVNASAILAAQQMLAEEGLDDLVDWSAPPSGVGSQSSISVEIENSSGTKTVNICNNKSCKPIYFNKHLVCSNNMELVSDANQENFCCSYNDINNMSEPEITFLTQHLQDFEEYIHDPDNFNTVAIMGLVLTDLMSFGILPKISKDILKFTLKPLIGNLVGHRASTFTKSLRKFNLISKIGKSEAMEGLRVFKKALVDGIKDGIEKGLQKVTGKGFEELAEKGSVKAITTSFRAIAELIPGLDIIMNIEMVFEFIGWVLEAYDVGGFKQYISNESILQQRDIIQGIILYNFSLKGVEPPLYFNLYNLKDIVSESASGTEYQPSACQVNNTPESSIPRNTKISILSDIYTIYKAAFTEYHHSLGGFKKDLPRSYKATIEYFLKEGTDMQEDFLDRATPNINDLPSERDNFVWNYLKNNLNKQLNMNGGTPKYIARYEKFTMPECIGISLNQSGVNLLNSINDKFGVVISKYYRRIKIPDGIKCCLSPDVAAKMPGKTNKSFTLEQDTLVDNTNGASEFPLMDYSIPTIKTQCTEGMDPDNLPGKGMREQHNYLHLSPETQIHPCDHSSGYNEDTGLCNFSQGWCTHMGYSSNETKYMPSSTRTNENTEYIECKKGTGESIAEFVAPEFFVEEAERHTG